MTRSLTFLFVSVLCISFQAEAQDKLNIKYGKISKDDFAPQAYAIDSNAAAVVLADIGSTQIVGNNSGWFSLEYKHFKRVRILNKNAYDIANVEIDLYKSSNDNREEELDNLKAATYTLENGEVVSTKLEKSAIFTEKQSRNNTVKKFTLPNLKEGCIIEFEYKITSDFLFNLRSWEFQGSYPRLWSEYEVSIPEFLGYLFLSQGYFPFHIKDNKTRNETFQIRNNQTAGATTSGSLASQVTDTRWVMKNVPALKEESFTSTLNNHIAKVDFQLSEYRYPLTPRPVMATWTQMTKDMLEDESFGMHLNRDNNWLDETVNPLVRGVADEEEKARLIYRFVQQNLTCTRNAGLMMTKTLKNVMKDKNGNVAEINLLLTAMLRHEKIDARPVILSTRGHGYVYAAYPLLDKFNYVVVQVNTGKKILYLDASRPMLGFGRLPAVCYNGPAVVIDEEATPLAFWADSLREKSVASVFVTVTDKGNIEGSKEKLEGYYSSLSRRSEMAEKGKEAVEKSLQKETGQDAVIRKLQLDSVSRFDEGIRMKYDFAIPAGGDPGILYINPFFGEAMKDNPFKSAERFYPVEMPFTIDELYVLNMNVPDSYTIDELPSSINLKLNEEDDGRFEYRISKEGNTVMIRSRILLKRAYYLPEEYDILREFFNIVVKKHNEQIVLKKKN